MEVSKSEVKRRLTEAEKDSSTATTRLVELAMPKHTRSASRTFTIMLQTLNPAIDDMGADAEKVVATVTGEGQ